jgi:transcriptional regulator with XRE-family HTH domain
MNNESHFSQTTLGRVVADERHSRGWTQVHLAKLAHVNRAYLSDVEQGHRNITMDILVRLASTLGMTASELIIKAELLHKAQFPVQTAGSPIST